MSPSEKVHDDKISSAYPKKQEKEEIVTSKQVQIHDVIGHFGNYQFLMFVFKVLIGATSAFNNLGVTFFAPSDFISYWCADGPQVATPMTNFSNHLFDSSLNDTSTHYSYVPKSSVNYINILSEFISNDARTIRHSRGLDLETPSNITRQCSYVSTLDNSVHKCTSFKYNTGIWISTIIEEWDLVCDRAWFISLNQSLYMSGFIVSFLVFGYISDRYGRWFSLLLGGSIEVLSGFGCAFSSSITMFMVFRFLLGLGNAGRSSASYLVMIEWVGPKWRMHISTLGTLGWVIGYCLMPWIQVYFLHFRHMQLFTCFYELIFMLWLLRLPESPRFLLTRKKFKKARQVLLMAAKFNGLIKEDTAHSCCLSNFKQDLERKEGTLISSTNFQLSSQMKLHKVINNGAFNRKEQHVIVNSEDATIEPYTMEEFERKFQSLADGVREKEFTSNESNLTILDLFKWNNLRRYALILFFIWASNSFVYYGIVLGVGSFGGTNLFSSFTLAGLIELPSVAFTILIMKFLPRRTTNIVISLVTGIACLLQIPFKYYDYKALQQATMLLAKLFNSMSFTCVLYQTMELFPTSIRQTAYSSCSLAGRIGSNLAPFTKELTQVTNAYVPSIIYTALSFLCAIFNKELPETKGSDLTDTLLEAEKFEETLHNSRPIIDNQSASSISNKSQQKLGKQ